jgi:6,7-dimethyl-8-ribityllumazine synthase
MNEFGGKLTAEGLKLGIVISRFNDFLTRQLLAGAEDCFARHGGSREDIDAVWVPGANELPMVAEKLAGAGKYNCIAALGAVIQGDTPHAELINTQVSRSLARTAAESGLPVINGVVCANSLEQAIERCGTKAGNKGWHAVLSAIEMARLYEQLQV